MICFINLTQIYTMPLFPETRRPLLNTVGQEVQELKAVLGHTANLGSA